MERDLDVAGSHEGRLSELDVEVGDDEGLLGDPRVRAPELLGEACAAPRAERERAVFADLCAAVEPGGDEVLRFHPGPLCQKRGPRGTWIGGA